MSSNRPRGGSGTFRFLLVLTVVLAFAAGGGAVAFYLSFLQDLPDLRNIQDYRPPLSSRVLDRESRVVGAFAYERRRLVPVGEIPEHVQLAFVASEDGGFFEHKGIDYSGILRAALANLRAGGEIKQGASTITQQMVKSLLLTPERTYRRKIRELYLARQIEQRFSKNEILYLYINQIYFGHGAWGIGEAASTYFAKPVKELTVSEAAMLAGLPQRPSEYSPFRNPESAEKRRRYVLGRMLADEFIDQPTYEVAIEDVPVLGPTYRAFEPAAAYFTEEVRRYLFDQFGGERVLRGGLVIETTLDMDLQQVAVDGLQRALIAQDRRQGYRGPLRQVEASAIAAEIEKLGGENEFEKLLAAALEAEAQGDSEAELEATLETPSQPSLPEGVSLLAVVTQVDPKAKTAQVAFGPGQPATVRLADVSWARTPDARRRSHPVRKIERIFSVGDVASFEILPAEAGDSGDEPTRYARLLQEPIVQGSVLSVEVGTGDVLAMVGGYDFYKSEFNRVTQALRQPGSAFKPLIYGAAIEQGYTPVSTLFDRPAVFKDPVSGFVWRPRNYERRFFGPIPMRYSLAHSINNATVHLFQDLGVDYVIDYVRRLGIQSPLSRDLSLAIGSSDVTLLELTSAYGVFPNKGKRLIPRFIRRVTDRDGQVLLENVPLGTPPPPVVKRLQVADPPADDGYPDSELLPTDRIISEADAFLMCDLMKAVVLEGTGRRAQRLGGHLGGKTGTTNEYADAWFMGFSPDVVTGVWVGHDTNNQLGYGESGAIAALPAWIDVMEAVMATRPVRDFDVPDSIVFQRIDRSTGLLADERTEDAYFQPFLEGTAPTETATHVSATTDSDRAMRDDSFN
jgi:penicillin-binding protein 1A